MSSKGSYKVTSQLDDDLWPLPSNEHSLASYSGTQVIDCNESWPLPPSTEGSSESSFSRSRSVSIHQEPLRSATPLASTARTASSAGSREDSFIFDDCTPRDLQVKGPSTSQIAEKEIVSTRLLDGPDSALPGRSVKAQPSPLRKLSLFIDEWTPMALVILYFIISVSAYIILPLNIVTVAWYIYLALAFFVSAAVTGEACASNRPARDARRARKRLAETGSFPTPDHLLPSLSLVIVAYLPNEKDIVMQQVRYALREIVYPRDRYTVYLVYNTPRPIEPLQSELHKLHEQYQNVKVIQVKESDSKADNLNYFLEHECSTDLIGIYDTDHYAHPHGPRWAAERFCRGDGTDIVQGRCVVYNYSDSWVSRAISAEFDMIYAVFHPGRAQSHGFGLFGGANGYWRASLLKQLKMHKHMLTEDIDSTLRAFASGAKMVHELNTVSYEQAPVTVAAFYKQRMRWAQGWFQVAIRHCTLALRGVPGIKLKSRLGLFFLLVFREAFFYILTQFSALLLGKFILQPPKSLRAVYSSLFGYPLSAWILIFNCFSLVVITTLTIRNRSEFTSPIVIVIYGLSMPVYFMILSVMGLVAHARELVKYEKWNPTERATKIQTIATEV